MKTTININSFQFFKVTIFVTLSLIIFHSCNLSESKLKKNQKKSSNIINLRLIDDSTVLIKDKKFKISELDAKLKQLGTTPIKKVYLSAFRFAKMGVITDIQMIIGSFNVPYLVYKFNNGDSIVKKLVPPPYPENLLVFNMLKSGTLFFREIEILNERQLSIILKEAIGETSEPIVTLLAESGTSYDKFSKQIKSINILLLDIDSTLKINETTWGYYEDIK